MLRTDSNNVCPYVVYKAITCLNGKNIANSLNKQTTFGGVTLK